MSQLKIEQFIEEHFGIKLTKPQLEMMAMISTGQVKMTVSLDARVYGKDVVRKSVLAYLQDGMKPVQHEQVDRFEVIDDTGRAYVKGAMYGTPVKVGLSYQDGGKTLKAFVSKK